LVEEISVVLDQEGNFWLKIPDKFHLLTEVYGFRLYSCPNPRVKRWQGPFVSVAYSNPEFWLLVERRKGTRPIYPFFQCPKARIEGNMTTGD